MAPTKRRICLAIGVLVAGCSSAHRGEQPCEPATEARDCEPDEVCRSTLEGDFFCMQTCEGNADCVNGEACINRLPGLPRVCWVGGPIERDEPCEATSSCGVGMVCTRDGVCQDACHVEGSDCSTPGLRCEWEACVAPVEPGAACHLFRACSPPYHSCRVETLYTCQAACRGATGSVDEVGVCPDGSECHEDLDCLDREPALADQCSRSTDGAVGCHPREECVMTTLGVSRCMLKDCDPANLRSCAGMCLPDPDSPTTYVCWIGGPSGLGESCTDHYDCDLAGCNAAGVCAPRCGEGLLPCAETTVGLGPHVCQDGVCTPEEG